MQLKTLSSPGNRRWSIGRRKSGKDLGKQETVSPTLEKQVAAKSNGGVKIQSHTDNPADDKGQERKEEIKGVQWGGEITVTDEIMPVIPHKVRELALADRTMKRLAVNSKLFNASDKGTKDSKSIGASAVGTVQESDLRIGRLLGKGGFDEVRLVQVKTNTSSQPRHDHNRNANMLSTPSTAASTPKDGYESYDTRDSADAEGPGMVFEVVSGVSPKKRQGQQSKCYVMKYISAHVHECTKTFELGVADIAAEARFLTVLSHMHIITLHYVSAGSLKDNYNCTDSKAKRIDGRDDTSSSKGRNEPHRFGYFILIDPLHDTLDKRILNQWMVQNGFEPNEDPPRKKKRNSICRLVNRRSHSNNSSGNHCTIAQKTCLVERLKVARDLASAVKYIHNNHIVFRDIKPDNVGFYLQRVNPKGKSLAAPRLSDDDTDDNTEVEDDCSDGMKNHPSGTRQEEVTKLFDFGLAKELKPGDKNRNTTMIANDTYKLTGRIGNRRYRAPEVGFSRPYNHKADMYSMGMLLYEVSMLVEPFKDIGNKHEWDLLRNARRPRLNHEYVTQATWPGGLAPLISACWASDFRSRPEMEEIGQRLESCIEELKANIVNEQVEGNFFSMIDIDIAVEERNGSCSSRDSMVRTPCPVATP